MKRILLQFYKMKLYIPKSEMKYPIPFVSSPLFPLLFLSLYFGQKHTPDTTNYVLPKYDFIIVGAGSAGATLAARLSEIPCVTVLLLEAGKSPPLMTEILAVSRAYFGTDIDWGYKTTPQNQSGRLLNNRQLYYPRGKAIGGSSVINAGMYVRGSRHIYDQWEKQGAIGWSYKDVLPYFIKAENNLSPESIDISYHGFRGPLTVENARYESPYKSAIYRAISELGYQKVDSNGRNQKGFYSFQITSRIGQRCSTGKAYLVPAEKRTNLHIVNNAFVIKIPVVADLPVGLNLQDHVQSLQAYYTTKLSPIATLLTDRNNIRQYINERSGPLSTSGGRYMAFLTNMERTFDDAVPDYLLSFYDMGVSGFPAQMNLQQKVYEQIFKRYENTSILGCVSELLTPKSRGFIKLRSSDPFDHPIIDPNYFDKLDDLQNIVEGLKKCDQILNTRALKSLGLRPVVTKYPGCEMFDRYSDDYLKCAVKSVPLTDYHPTSTCQMGNPYLSTTVVDPRLRVKGIFGLRIVDASVMPIIPNGNTNAPTIMVAEKAADIIKEELQWGQQYNIYKNFII